VGLSPVMGEWGNTNGFPEKDFLSLSMLFLRRLRKTIITLV
jgi:hypothetical protein